jgi:hypothetical protein
MRLQIHRDYSFVIDVKKALLNHGLNPLVVLAQYREKVTRVELDLIVPERCSTVCHHSGLSLLLYYRACDNMKRQIRDSRSLAIVDAERHASRGSLGTLIKGWVLHERRRKSRCSLFVAWDISKAIEPQTMLSTS